MHWRLAISHVQTTASDFYTIASVRCPDQGTGEAQNVARDMIEDLDPHWILLVGIAGGVPAYEYTLGDVIVATRVYDFTKEAVHQDGSHEFDVAGGPAHRDVQTLLAHLPAMGMELGDWNSEVSISMPRPSVRLDQIDFDCPQKWQKKIKDSLTRHFGEGSKPRSPLVAAGTIASSDRLIKSTEILEATLSSGRSILAFEMELAGVYRAAHRQYRTYPVVAIRGLSDIVGLERDPDWTSYACHAAAAFAMALVKVRPMPPLGLWNPSSGAVDGIRGKAHAYVTAIEFTLEKPIERFSEEDFKHALYSLFGTNIQKIRIASIRPGSVIVVIKGESEELIRIVEALRGSIDLQREFAKRTGFVSMQFSETQKDVVVRAQDADSPPAPRQPDGAPFVGEATSTKIPPSEGRPIAAPLSADEGFSYDVFISYSSKDKAWVRGELLPRLEARGLKACVDFRDFEPGAPSVTEMERAVSTSRKTLLVLTRHYLESAWTEFEHLMLQTLDPASQQRRLIPLLRERCELPLRIRYLTYVNFVDPEDWIIAWTRLLTVLGAPPEVEPPEKRAVGERLQTGSKTAQGFVYGRPVWPSEFLDRETELGTIFVRLRNSESTAVVGEPHIGKTSLLLKLADPATQREHLGSDAQYLVVSLLDLQPRDKDYTPHKFWEKALEPLQEHRDTNVLQLLKGINQATDLYPPLEDLFKHLGNRGWRLILMLDEFERLLSLPNFQDSSFFTQLRSLTTLTGGLALVTASRLSVAEMNKRGRGLLDIGSPFFNHMANLRLHPFDEHAVDVLLDGAGGALTLDDRHFIRRIAGRHPFLLQASTAALLETTGLDQHALAAKRFYERISFHFDDLWETLDDRTRTAATILSLVELGGHALGQDFAFGEIERVDAFGHELRELEERGMADQVSKGWQFDWKHLLVWRGERWTIGAQAFAWWVRDVVIARSRNIPTYDEWLANQRYKLLLTEEQWIRLIGAVRNAPEWAIRGVGGLARALLEELIGRHNRGPTS